MIYLDNAATTFPKPRSVGREMIRCLNGYAGNPGRGSHPLSMKAAEAVFDARQTLARFFRVGSEENVIFTKSATEALNLSLFGAMGTKRGRIITTNLEHNSVLRPLEKLKNKGFEIDVIDATGSDDEVVSSLTSAIRSDTRAFVCIHASNVCPRVLPVKRLGKICREKGVLFILDAAQSAGIYDVDVNDDGVDILCVPGHKGLFGPEGTGAAVFRDGFDFSSLEPHTFGGTGINSADADQGRFPPESFEAGTLAVPSIVGLGEGVKYVMKTGTDNIRRHEAALYRYAKSELTELGAVIYGDFSDGSVLSFNLPGLFASDIAARLGRMSICVRAGMHCAPDAHTALGTGGDAVRLGFSPMNEKKDVAALIDALRKIRSE